MTYSTPSWYKRNETDTERQAREAQAIRDNAERRAATERSHRQIFSSFMLWRVCPDKRCKRAHACRGDVETCNTERWRVVVPDWYRVVLGKVIDLARDGMAWNDAVKAAIADMESRAALLEKAEAPLTGSTAPRDAPARPAVDVSRSAPPSPGPRIRML